MMKNIRLRQNSQVRRWVGSVYVEYVLVTEVKSVIVSGCLVEETGNLIVESRTRVVGKTLGIVRDERESNVKG